MPTFDVNGVQYHYLDDGSGTPIVLLHGFMGSVDSWSQITPALSQKYRVVTIDLLGHGLSSSPADAKCYQIERAASDLAELLTTIDANPINLSGYSMGARLALYFTLIYPQFVSKLILESGSPGLETENERDHRITNDDHLAEQLQTGGIAAFTEHWENLSLFATQGNLSDDAKARQRQQRLQNNPLGLANSLRGMGTGKQPPLWKKLDELTAPTLLIVGALDEKFSTIAGRMAQMMPNASLKIVPNAGHNVHLEQPTAYLNHINSFLQRQ